MDIIRASADHAQTVGSLLHAFNAEFGENEPSAAELSGRFAVLLTRPDVLVHLAVDGQEAVGFAFTTLRPTPYFDGPLGQLEELYVQPARRSGGVGTLLLERLIADLTATGCEELMINVDEPDTDARRFYERHGFFHQDPSTGDAMLGYLRPLNQP